MEISTTATSIKVANLRKKGFSNLREWMKDPNNIYVGRHGRIFIDKVIFHYPGSKWQNPFKLKDYSLKDSLSLYTLYLLNTGLIYDLHELKGKNLGCFCDHQKDKNDVPICHAQVLVDLIEKCSDIIEEYRKLT
jgi:hypothetical protein|tara:strand:- start:52 stop:453 length:402 start_codon:yes stop_codon:yes gene_type:complete